MEDFEGFGEAFFTSNQPQQTTVVQCKNCGAKNSVTSGEFMACEYCGSGLEF